MEYPLVRACIDLAAIQSNIENLKQITNPNSEFMAVVKANAYGHGAVPVAEKALQSGADWLGVARFREAVELREAGIDAPILVFGYVHPARAEKAVELDLVVSVYDFEMARALSQKSVSLNKAVKVHLKVDTGMGRVGIIIGNMDQGFLDTRNRETCIREIEKIHSLPGIDCTGIYTHFATADSKDRSHTDQQIKLFASLLKDLEKKGIKPGTCHAANSAGIIGFPDSHFDMVRAGISIYGLYPSSEVDPAKINLHPAMSLKSVITGIRKVPKGFFVSYGKTYETRKETKLASVPIGYADGFSRFFSSKGSMLVKGCRAHVAGRVCMDQTLIDVGHIPEIKTGDEVVIIGSQGRETMSADELANSINTINYEIVSALTSRVKRIYSDSGSG